jgi:hypothetical protein
MSSFGRRGSNDNYAQVGLDDFSDDDSSDDGGDDFVEQSARNQKVRSTIIEGTHPVYVQHFCLSGVAYVIFLLFTTTTLFFATITYLLVFLSLATHEKAR